MKITAKVKNIISRKNGGIMFSLKTLEVLAANQVEKRTLKKTVIAKISDNAPIHEKDTIEIIGSFSVGKYGTVLNVSKYSITKRTQEEQLVSFLIDGSNKQIAKILVEKFGLDTLSKIKNKDEMSRLFKILMVTILLLLMILDLRANVLLIGKKSENT